MTKRPPTVLIACIVMAVVSGSLIVGFLQPPVQTGSPIPPSFMWVLLMLSLGIVLAVLAWFGKGWARWVYLLWIVVPILFGALGEAVLQEKELFGEIFSNFARMLISPFGLLSLVPVVLLFLPASNRWFQQ